MVTLPMHLDFMTKLVVEFSRLMVLGGFNPPSLGPEMAQEFMDTVTTMDLVQLNNSSTHRGHHPLNLFFVLRQ